MKQFILPVLSILFLSTSLALATDNTLTSYYPSASGNYDKIKAKEFRFNESGIVKLKSNMGNSCSELNSTVGNLGRIVINASGNLVVCDVPGTGSDPGNGDEGTPTKTYWRQTTNGDLIPNVSTARFGFKPDNTSTFVGFKRDSNSGDLVATAVNASNVEYPMFSVGMGNNGVSIFNGRKLSLLTDTLNATGNSLNKRLSLDSEHVGFIGLGASSTGLELHGGTSATDGPPSMFVGSAGNVGINLGGASPTHNLDVKGSAAILKNNGTDVAVMLNQDGTIQMVGANATTGATTLSVTTGDTTGILTTAGGMTATTGDITAAAGNIKATTGDIEAVAGAVKGFIVVKSSANCPGTCEDGTMWLSP